MVSRLACVAAIALLCGLPDSAMAEERDAAAGGNSSAAVAQKMDATLTDEAAVPSDQTDKPAGLADDETFLRRASQDLIGELPTPEEVTAFVLDPSQDKRAQAIERLLADPRFGENWARYYRDVILYRRTDEKALAAGPSIVNYLTEKFNNGAGWDEIARAFISARGDVREHGNTGIIMAQMGQAPEIAAEVARIFMGVQIQCAQCHDHPTDRWKRTQFHELTAFFPRIAVRPVRDEDKKRVSFEVVSRDVDPRKKPKNNKPQATAEHYMPDLNDPSAKGTVMRPVFFVTGQKMSLGTKDADRRETLARWVTSKQNPWFAKAFVNRLWAELVGHGFYEPVDDLGPDRTVTAPRTLDLLAEEFIAHGYDTKWLLRTIMATQAYQQDTNSHRGTSNSFVSSCPQPLRADQVFDALASALDIDEPSAKDEKRNGKPVKLARGPRGEFDRTFGFDPSAPRDEVGGSIPQALLLMNSQLLNKSISGKNQRTMLGKLLASDMDDEAIANELYLRCLAREPKPAELAACVEYVRSNKQRADAFEDILWALLNSTEFTHRN